MAVQPVTRQELFANFHKKFSGMTSVVTVAATARMRLVATVP